MVALVMADTTDEGSRLLAPPSSLARAPFWRTVLLGCSVFAKLPPPANTMRRPHHHKQQQFAKIEKILAGNTMAVD